MPFAINQSDITTDRGLTADIGYRHPLKQTAHVIIGGAESRQRANAKFLLKARIENRADIDSTFTRHELSVRRQFVFTGRHDFTGIENVVVGKSRGTDRSR